MFAEPPQTAKLKSILNQEPGPLIAQQKSQLTVTVEGPFASLKQRVGAIRPTSAT